MGKTVIRYTDENGEVQEEVRYDLSGKWEKGATIKVSDLKRRRKLLQKGFTNLNDKEKEEWIKYFGENDSTKE